VQARFLVSPQSKIPKTPKKQSLFCNWSKFVSPRIADNRIEFSLRPSAYLCGRTGLGKEIRGEGLVGLTRGFMYAGATTVVASLWKVDDEATAELMKSFYTEMLQNKKTPDEALRSAQNSIRQIPRWRAPHNWAGFTLQGEYHYVVNSKRGWRRYSIRIVIGLVGIVLVSVTGFYRYRLRASALK